MRDRKASILSPPEIPLRLHNLNRLVPLYSQPWKGRAPSVLRSCFYFDRRGTCTTCHCFTHAMLYSVLKASHLKPSTAHNLIVFTEYEVRLRTHSRSCSCCREVCTEYSSPGGLPRCTMNNLGTTATADKQHSELEPPAPNSLAPGALAGPQCLPGSANRA